MSDVYYLLAFVQKRMAILVGRIISNLFLCHSWPGFSLKNSLTIFQLIML